MMGHPARLRWRHPYSNSEHTKLGLVARPADMLTMSLVPQSLVWGRARVSELLKFDMIRVSIDLWKEISTTHVFSVIEFFCIRRVRALSPLTWGVEYFFAVPTATW